MALVQHHRLSQGSQRLYEAIIAVGVWPRLTLLRSASTAGIEAFKPLTSQGRRLYNVAQAGKGIAVLDSRRSLSDFRHTRSVPLVYCYLHPRVPVRHMGLFQIGSLR